MTGAVGRGFVPPIQEDCGDCRSVSGPGGILFPLFPGDQAHWWVPPHPQPTRPQVVYSSCQVPHLDPHFHSSGSSQRLVDGVAGSQGRLFACADTPQSLAVSSVCSQEPGRGANCLSMESSPVWLSHCPQSFYQTSGSVSRSSAFAGMSDVPLHRRHLPCTGVCKPDSVNQRHQSLLSLQAGFHHKPREVGPCSISGNTPLGSSDPHGQGIVFSIPASDRSDSSCSSSIVRLNPGLCSMPSAGDRDVGVLPRSCHPLHVSSSSLSNVLRDDDRSLRNEGGSHFGADPLVISGDPVSSGILGLTGILCPKAFQRWSSEVVERSVFSPYKLSQAGDCFRRLVEITEMAVWRTCPSSDGQHNGDALSEQGGEGPGPGAWTGRSGRSFFGV